MLKPSNTWNWYYEENKQTLMLDLGDDLVFQTNLARKLLVNCALSANEFTVDDATSFQTFRDPIHSLSLSEPRQAELTLYCVAAKRFHKPVQPRSWFFDHQSEGYAPQEADVIRLVNQYGSGLFIVLEVGDGSSLCTFVELEEMELTSAKSLKFGDSIKVMHDRMVCANHMLNTETIALVG
ncbi:cell division protein ZapC [Vibrio sp. 10N.286.49.B3]|uniref:cell division protein ZapC n=1 Tax=Vibrio sp. 10N.286.49.B3 TaxID=1880855 RepID=UPI000C84535C|nr:cell division protein ZapC [Vibrio sp. 10N.286.49.B3]PMH46500.1 cell division protein ZapC [Vibrio sp. 10N.286.49.B3]